MSLEHLRRGAVVLAVATAVSSLGPAAALAAPGGKGPAARRPDFTLTTLHANDLESALLPSTLADGGTYGGADRFAELMQQQRAAVTGKPGRGRAGKRGVLTISAGDNLLPGPNLAAGEGSGAPLYDATPIGPRSGPTGDPLHTLLHHPRQRGQG